MLKSIEILRGGGRFFFFFKIEKKVKSPRDLTGKKRVKDYYFLKIRQFIWVYKQKKNLNNNLKK